MARHAVVTGASSGIGHAITTTLLAAGWKVTGLSRRDPGFAVGSGSFEWLAADLSEPDSLPGLLQEVGPSTRWSTPRAS
ncbi:SDR family NAD(P)-dependent oxidoreductase [Arthrobacter sp.]|uniref:SDR family NAD(P)-dependent oxidoreductase n=1 Tax=Arthrobacter sp. TaxID=1667 RepID=UPI003A9569F2